MIRAIVFYIQPAAQKVTLRLLRTNHSLDRLPMSIRIEKKRRGFQGREIKGVLEMDKWTS